MRIISKFLLGILFFTFLSVSAQKNQTKKTITNAQLTDTLTPKKKRSLLKKSIVPYYWKELIVIQKDFHWIKLVKANMLIPRRQ